MNIIEKFLNKDSKDFKKEDILKFCKANNIEILNFRYVAGDGRLKTLNFSVDDPKYLNKILSSGERVDGSSLFKGIDASSSDLYVIPKYSTAFVNPFSPVPAIDIICSFYDKDGNPCSFTPENVLKKAEKNFIKNTGLELYSLGELEYYLISPKNNLYPQITQKGYHESYPYNKWEFFRVEAASLISKCGGHIKYAHSEVGFIRNEEQEMSQNEIEFLPVPISRTAEELSISKWILYSLAYKYGVNVTLAPKISIGHAGSGLHFHSCLMKKGKNMMLNGNNLSQEAIKLIMGYLKGAKSLTAFGNTLPTSYLRLVPNQEAPTNICWGYRNRSALIRVPLSWNGIKNMAEDLNGKDKTQKNQSNQTVEIRSADGSANIHLFLAAMACLGVNGFKNKNAIEESKKMYADKNIFHNEEMKKNMESLPQSCFESSENLLKERELYEKDNVFPSFLIDSIANKLKSYNDKNLSEKLYGKEEEIKKLVEEYLYL